MAGFDVNLGALLVSLTTYGGLLYEMIDNRLRDKENKDTQVGLGDRIGVLERQVVNVTQATINNNNKAPKFDTQVINLEPSIVGYAYLAFILTLVAFFSYIIWQQYNDLMRLYGKELGYLHEISALRQRLVFAEKEVEGKRNLAELREKEANEAKVMMTEYRKAADDNKAAADKEKTKAETTAKETSNHVWEQALAVNELMQLVKEKCVETDGIVADFKTDNVNIKKLVKDVTGALPRVEAEAFQRGKAAGRAEMLEEIEGVKAE
ncbi:uncharacterized protein CTRU02_212183 [Colletotrichum truncatum]|uniref:Uncharacterized protein n=1 Tax=Colletotrichum truncatum TaxID=5467 RepID=A0ACC3YMT3_COLTU|nr:uncharacterized protein CTRU02_06746 [Colletotrichum truncatum]KAF6792129.1 hypothetical protein CTRU02_06746 [Colletotrichum truncatum]